MVHRDSRAGNVMLNRHGEIKVMDFGIARAVADTQATMTQTAQVIGTAQYLSPEQARGERVDSRSDLYSVGCLLYELLTGRPPFTGDSPVAIAYQHVREAPVPPSRVDPDLPPWADAIVLKAMEKDPNARYQSAGEMRSDVQRALSGFPVQGAQPMSGSHAAAGQGTGRMDPLGQTRLKGQNGSLRPYEYGPQETGLGPRRRRRIWPWVAAVLALAVIAAAILAYQLVSGTGSSVAVPSNLPGMKLLAAERAVQHAGLRYKTNPHPSTAGPYDTVLSTRPSPGTKVAKGSQVVLNYNVSPKKAALPTVSGLTVAAAKAKLSAGGWSNVTTAPSLVASLKYKNGDVISTNPPAGQTISVSTQIVLNVSGGGVPVPALRGDTQALALSKLSQLGLYNQVFTASGPPGTTPGTVWKASPSRGKPVLPGGSVAVYVAPTPTPPPSSPPPSSGSPSPSPSGSSSPSPSSSSTASAGLPLPLPGSPLPGSPLPGPPLPASPLPGSPGQIGHVIGGGGAGVLGSHQLQPASRRLSS